MCGGGWVGSLSRADRAVGEAAAGLSPFPLVFTALFLRAGLAHRGPLRVRCPLWQQRRQLGQQLKRCAGAAVASPARELHPALPVTAAVARHGHGGAAWRGPDVGAAAWSGRAATGRTENPFPGSGRQGLLRFTDLYVLLWNVGHILLPKMN